MANAIVTLKIMPDSPETDMDALHEKVLKEIESFCGETQTKKEIEPIAFGLKALKIIFVMDEAKGATDQLEEKISEFPDVNSVEVTDVRRAIG